MVLQIWKFWNPTVETEAAQRSNAEAVGCRAGHVGRGLFPNSLCVPDGLRTCPTTLQSFTLNACETPGTPVTPETPRLPGLLGLPRLPRHLRLPRLLRLPRHMAHGTWRTPGAQGALQSCAVPCLRALLSCVVCWCVGVLCTFFLPTCAPPVFQCSSFMNAKHHVVLPIMLPFLDHVVAIVKKQVRRMCVSVCISVSQCVCLW